MLTRTLRRTASGSIFWSKARKIIASRRVVVSDGYLFTSFGGGVVQFGQSAGREATLESGWIRAKLLSILGHTNIAAPTEVRNDAYLRMVRHAAAGDLTMDYEVMPLDRVAEAWELQEASPNRKLVLSPSGVP